MYGTFIMRIEQDICAWCDKAGELFVRNNVLVCADCRDRYDNHAEDEYENERIERRFNVRDY